MIHSPARRDVNLEHARKSGDTRGLRRASRGRPVGRTRGVEGAPEGPRYREGKRGVPFLDGTSDAPRSLSDARCSPTGGAEEQGTLGPARPTTKRWTPTRSARASPVLLTSVRSYGASGLGSIPAGVCEMECGIAEQDGPRTARPARLAKPTSARTARPSDPTKDGNDLARRYPPRRNRSDRRSEPGREFVRRTGT